MQEIVIKNIRCYGPMVENNNYMVAADDSEGFEIDFMWGGEGETTWSQVVNKITAAFPDYEIYEISAV